MCHSRHLPLVLLLLAMVPHPGQAGTPGPAYLVADTLEGTEASLFQPRFLGVVGGRLYFAGRNVTTGLEPWRTDGTPEGTELVADLCGGACGLRQPLASELFDDDLFFAACELGDCSLWRTDGTSLTRVFEGAVEQMAVWNGALYAATELGELRRADGSSPGTLLADFGPRFFLDLVPAETALFVLAKDNLAFTFQQPEPYQLWRTDGTPEGTFLIRESPGSVFRRGLTLHPELFEGKAVFTDQNTIWVSDSFGAEPLLEDPPFTVPEVLHTIDGVLFVYDEGRRLWRTDATPEGTSLVAEAARPGRILRAAFQGELYFVLGRESGVLHRTVGLIHEETVHEFPQPVTRLEVLDGRLYVGIGPALPRVPPDHELWTVSRAGVSRVFDLPENATFADLTSWDDALYFDLTTPAGSELARYTADAGVEALTRHANGLSGDPRQITRHRDGVIFEALPLSPTARWWSDGTAQGSFRLPGEVDFSRIVAAGDEAFLQVDQEVLTVDDGGQVVRVFDLPPGETFADDFMIPTAAGLLFLTYAESGVSLWTGDRESGATRRFAEAIYASVVYSNGLAASPLYERLDDDVLLFLEGTVWRTDGTADGTRKVFDAGETCDCFFLRTLRAGRHVFFIGREYNAPTQSWRLWRTDGTAVGTSLVAAFPPEDEIRKGGFAPTLAGVGGRAIFVKRDPATGAELWASDGTAAGTGMVRDLKPGAGSSSPLWLTVLDDRLYFSADDGTHGRELWVSDGTAQGTRLVTDLVPGPRSSNVWSLTAVDSRLVFAADDGVHGMELWASDGSAEHTRLLQDLQGGPLGSDPHFFTAAGGLVFFNAGRDDLGYELWALPRDALFEPLEASFRASPQPAIQGKPITFVDASEGRPDSWCWRFGDEPAGAPECSATSPRARHGYLKPGVYTVTLRVRRVLPGGAEEESAASSDVSVAELCPGCVFLRGAAGGPASPRRGRATAPDLRGGSAVRRPAAAARATPWG